MSGEVLEVGVEVAAFCRDGNWEYVWVAEADPDERSLHRRLRAVTSHPFPSVELRTIDNGGAKRTTLSPIAQGIGGPHGPLKNETPN